MQTVDKLDIADEMIESAIQQFLDHQHYFAAFNLAGVAEEIYGKALRIDGGKDSQMELIDAVRLLTAQRGGPDIPVREWKKIATEKKNSIKHLDSASDRHIQIDVEDEARLMIGEALSNHTKLARSVTSEIQRFYEFGNEYARRSGGAQEQ